MPKFAHLVIRVLARVITFSEIIIKCGVCMFAFFLMIRIEYSIIELALSALNIALVGDIVLLLVSLLCFPTSFLLFYFIRTYNVAHLRWARHFYRNLCKKPDYKGKINVFFAYLTIIDLFYYLLFLGYYLVTDSWFMQWKIGILISQTFDLGKLIGLSEVSSFMYFVYSVIFLCLLSCLTISRPISQIWKSAKLRCPKLCGCIIGLLYTLGIVVVYFPFLFVVFNHEMQWQYEYFVNDVLLRKTFGTTIQYRYMHHFLLPSLTVLLLNMVILITDIRRKRFSFSS